METFLITIQPQKDGAWPVKADHHRRGQLLPITRYGVLHLDSVALVRQMTPRDYGTVLGHALFQGDVRDAFIRARAVSQTHLHVVLTIEAPNLRHLRWERLCAPLDTSWDFLALDQRTPLALTLPVVAPRAYPQIQRDNLRALLVGAHPTNLRTWGLEPFDLDALLASTQTALTPIPTDILAASDDALGLPTLDALCAQLTQRPHAILHVICHGRYLPDTGETILYLTDRHNQAQAVRHTEIIERLRRIGSSHPLPRCIFLAACQTAVPETGAALGGLAQHLLHELGIPAVVAMTDRISVETAHLLGARFYQRLREHGQPERALNEAYAGSADRLDSTVPVLYSRLGRRSIFLVPSQPNHALPSVGGDVYNFSGNLQGATITIKSTLTQILHPTPPLYRSAVQRMVEDYEDIFGGRDAELDVLDTFLSQETQRCALLLALTGRGKTALLIHWSARVQAVGQWRVIFIPISLRYETATIPEAIGGLGVPRCGKDRIGNADQSGRCLCARCRQPDFHRSFQHWALTLRAVCAKPRYSGQDRPPGRNIVCAEASHVPWTNGMFPHRPYPAASTTEARSSWAFSIS